MLISTIASLILTLILKVMQLSKGIHLLLISVILGPCPMRSNWAQRWDDNPSLQTGPSWWMLGWTWLNNQIAHQACLEDEVPNPNRRKLHFWKFIALYKARKHPHMKGIEPPPKPSASAVEEPASPGKRVRAEYIRRAGPLLLNHWMVGFVEFDYLKWGHVQFTARRWGMVATSPTTPLHCHHSS